MSRFFSHKPVIIAGLMLMLLIPIRLISGLVRERKAQQADVLREVADSDSGRQRIVGPLLTIPYRVRSVVHEDTYVSVNGVTTTVPHDKDVFTDHAVTLLPTSLTVDTQVTTETLYRGLHRALTFTADARLVGTFDINLAELAGDASVTVGEPFLSVGISDVRGIRNTPRVDWEGKTLTFEPDSKLSLYATGIHAPIPGFDGKRAATYHFALPLQLLGTDALEFVPVGKDTRVKIASKWPHPSFYGRSLPTHRDVKEDGFTADWQTSWFNTNLNRAVQEAIDGAKLLPTDHDFGVRFIQPVDEYQQTERALKYAILFVLLTFTGFFLFEILKNLQIHPMQYALVGAALAMFYLLLIALSEHIAFATAYLLSSLACVALNTFYLAHVLQHWRRGVAFGALLGMLNATLYALLQSEDNALLLGALLLFGALAAVMVLTRRLDWYQLRATAPVPE
jgi:inner membrane protein